MDGKGGSWREQVQSEDAGIITKSSRPLTSTGGSMMYMKVALPSYAIKKFCWLTGLRSHCLWDGLHGVTGLHFKECNSSSNVVG